VTLFKSLNLCCQRRYPRRPLPFPQLSQLINYRSSVSQDPFLPTFGPSVFWSVTLPSHLVGLDEALCLQQLPLVRLRLVYCFVRRETRCYSGSTAF